MKLADILKPLDTGSVVIRGVTIPLRAVLAIEESELERQDPGPIITTETIGTEQLELDKQQHSLRRKTQVFGLAAGLTNDKGELWDYTRDRKWVKAWALEIAGQMTDLELAIAYDAAKGVGFVLPKELQKTGNRIGTAEKPGN